MKVVIISERTAPVLFPGVDCVVVGGVGELERHRNADLYVDLDFKPERSRLHALSQLFPTPVMVNAVLNTTVEIGQPFIRINGWPGMLERTVHELAVPDTSMATQIGPLYEKLGRSFRLAPDIPGMITARILAVLINEAWYTWQDGVSTQEEIDTAMKLGTNYPMGPFEWGMRIGLHRVVELLDVMSMTDPRYAPAERLKNAGNGIKI